MLYMDGANMNALVGIARPGDFGVDVMHLNLHKTFSTPHGGGGPGAGPVAVKKSSGAVPARAAPEARGQEVGVRLRPPEVDRTRAGLLRQLRRAGARAGLHPGARRRRPAQRHHGRGAERQLHPQSGSSPTSICPTRRPTCTKWFSATIARPSSGVHTGDIAKRLIDYGFHPYTVSFPLIVHGALMIEPTETESKQELDLFVDAMILDREGSGIRSAAGEDRAALDTAPARWTK